MGKNRVRQLPAAGKQPRQSVAGYYPKSWRKLPANVRRKEVTAEEALAAFRNEPGANNLKQRVYVYGVDLQSRPKELGIGASATRRGPAVRRLEQIAADVEAYRVQAEINLANRLGADPLPQIASMLRREMEKDVRAYEQGLMVDWASRQMGRRYSRVVGIWVAS